MSFIINGEEFHHIYLFGDSHLRCFGKKSLNNKKYSLFLIVFVTNQNILVK